MNRSPVVIIIAALVVGVVGGYIFGSYQAYTKGYDKALVDAKAAQEAAGAKAAAEAAKASNPFQAVNPLEDITANPFEKAQKVLNPFQ